MYMFLLSSSSSRATNIDGMKRGVDQFGHGVAENLRIVHQLAGDRLHSCAPTCILCNVLQCCWYWSVGICFCPDFGLLEEVAEIVGELVDMMLSSSRHSPCAADIGRDAGMCLRKSSWQDWKSLYRTGKGCHGRPNEIRQPGHGLAAYTLVADSFRRGLLRCLWGHLARDL